MRHGTPARKTGAWPARDELRSRGARALPERGRVDAGHGSVRAGDNESVKDPLQRYAKDGLTVTFDPRVCTHSGVCVRGSSTSST